MSAELREAFQRYAPRWFKVIRWRDLRERFVESQRLNLLYIYGPMILCYGYLEDQWPYVLAIKKPQSEKERMELKELWNKNIWMRDWEMGQYSEGVPPKYDVWYRRRNYPEHYGDKYNGKKMDNIYS